MKLIDFLLVNGVSFAEFAYVIGCSECYCWSIAHGAIPSSRLCVKISDVTGGKVRIGR